MQNRPNTPSFIEDHVYSAQIIRNLHDGLLPGAYYRNVTDFGKGSLLHIKTLGSVTIQDGAEEVPFDYTPIETGEITMTITEHVGDAWYVTDELREDGAQIDALMAGRAAESTRAIQETFETRFLARANSAQVNNDPNVVNGFAHRMVATGPNQSISLADIAKMKLAFDKANVPTGGRIAIVDPVTEYHLLQLVQMSHDVTPFGERILANGLQRDHNWLFNFYGFNFITSNRLPHGTFGDGADTVTNGVANIFMSLSDDNTKPIMAAWRRMPRVESERNKDLRRDEFVTSCRFGFGVQRVDTLGVIISNASI